jgi:hypothetical protein
MAAVVEQQRIVASCIVKEGLDFLEDLRHLPLDYEPHIVSGKDAIPFVAQSVTE